MNRCNNTRASSNRNRLAVSLVCVAGGAQWVVNKHLLIRSVWKSGSIFSVELDNCCFFSLAVWLSRLEWWCFFPTIDDAAGEEDKFFIFCVLERDTFDASLNNRKGVPAYVRINEPNTIESIWLRLLISFVAVVVVHVIKTDTYS